MVGFVLQSRSTLDIGGAQWQSGESVVVAFGDIQGSKKPLARFH